MIQVGQCGNQIGRRFWELALVEHAKSKSDADFDLGPDLFSHFYCCFEWSENTPGKALSSFFRNVDSRSGRELKAGFISSNFITTIVYCQLRSRTSVR